MPATLEDGWSETEQGNTLLTSEDGCLVAWVHLPGSDQKLEVAFNPKNWPSFEVKLLSAAKSSDESLAAHINKNLTYWLVRTCDVPEANLSDDGGSIVEKLEEDE